jgi:hypothetical protein
MFPQFFSSAALVWVLQIHRERSAGSASLRDRSTRRESGWLRGAGPVTQGDAGVEGIIRVFIHRSLNERKEKW